MSLTGAPTPGGFNAGSLWLYGADLQPRPLCGVHIRCALTSCLLVAVLPASQLGVRDAGVRTHVYALAGGWSRRRLYWRECADLTGAPDCLAIARTAKASRRPDKAFRILHPVDSAARDTRQKARAIYR